MSDVDEEVNLGQIVVVGLHDGARTFSLTKEGISFGRHPECNIVVNDHEISRRHAKLEFLGTGELILTDQESANGTSVNGKRIEWLPIENGDEISLGVSERFRYRYVAPVRPAAPSLPRRSTVEKTVPRIGSSPSTKPSTTASTMYLPQLEKNQARLQLVVDQFTVQDLDVPPKGLIVGRDPQRSSYSEFFDHESVSAANAEFRWVGRDLVISDLGSRNGTYVNGKRTKTHQLQEADFIRLGDYVERSILFRSGHHRALRVKDISLDKPLIRIGRDPTNELPLDHPAISRFHSELRKEGTRYVLSDLGSSNGTFVNGKAVTKHVLEPQDKVAIGPVQFRFDGFAFEQQNAGNDGRIDILQLSKQLANNRLVLDNISVAIPPRAFVGLLGPSGCGKSTFLDALSGLRPATGGAVLINGLDLYKYSQSFSTMMGLVPQEDVVHRQLTVDECVQYAAGLRLPADTAPGELGARVDEVLTQVGLSEHRETTVGLLSGGQRKRVSIAIEILAKPSILLLDEPTAGLDPHSEVQIMQLFRELANQGATLVTTTHVLGSFNLFDAVMTLVQGKLVFWGSPERLLSYFEVDAPHQIYSRLAEKKRPDEWRRRFQRTEDYQELTRQLPSDRSRAKKGARKKSDDSGSGGSRQRHNGWRQWRLLVSRYWTIMSKDNNQLLFLLLQAPFVALLVSLISDTPNAPGTLFMVVFAALWLGTSNAIREISDERAITRRERQAGLSLMAYVFSKLTVLGGIGAVQSTLIIMVLALTHLQFNWGGLEGNLLAALAVTFLVSLNGTLIGLTLSAFFTGEKALIWFPLILIPQLLLAGLFVPVRAIDPIIPLTNQQFAELVAAQAEVEVPPRVAEILVRSEFGQRVRGGIRLSEDAQDTLGQLMAGPTSEMGGVLRFVSSFCVSRWGLEALGDLYLHGDHTRQRYAYMIHNSIHISLHPDDARRLKELLVDSKTELEPQGFHWQDYSYYGVLLVFPLAMIVMLTVVLKRSETHREQGGR